MEDILRKFKTNAVRIGRMDYYSADQVDDACREYASHSITWSVEDFIQMAQQKYGEDWNKYYDETKFDDALLRMIHKHDAEIGITWETVKYYLEEYCNKQTYTKIYKDLK